MNKDIALDTSVVFPMFKNDEEIITRVKGISNIFLPFPVVAEVHIGFLIAKTSPATLPARKNFESFSADASLIGCTEEIAIKYAEINYYLRQKGSLIPQNDIWIAACCLIADKPLATRDSHFTRISDLKLEMW